MKRLADALSRTSRRGGAVLVALGLLASRAHAQSDQTGTNAPPPPVPSGGPQDPGPAAPPQPPPPTVPAPWQGRLDELDARTRALEEERVAAHKNAPVVKGEGPVFQTDETGFAMASRDGLYQIRFRGLLQVDGRAFLGDDALSVNDAFQIRRVRPILAGTVLGLVDFLISPDFGNNGTTLTDAYLDTHPRPWLRLRVGKFKPPYGLERLQADQDLTFIERSLDQWLTPQREVGVQLWGDILGGIVRYEAAIFNGNPDGVITEPDTNKAKTYGGRIFVQPFNTPSLKWLGQLGVGIAGSTGKEQGSASNSWLPTFKSAGQLTIFSYLSSTTDPGATIFAQGRHSRVNPQLYYYNGPFGLLAEWVKERQEIARGTDTGALKNSAGHVTASFAIGGDVTYQGLKPRHPLDLAQGTFGALELGFRYNWLKADSAAFSTAADPAKSVSKAQGFGVALNWQLSRNLKASVNYEQTSFDGGAAMGADRKTEKVLIGRYQVSF